MAKMSIASIRRLMHLARAVGNNLKKTPKQKMN